MAKDKSEQSFVFSVDLKTVLLATNSNVSTMYYGPNFRPIIYFPTIQK